MMDKGVLVKYTQDSNSATVTSAIALGKPIFLSTYIEDFPVPNSCNICGTSYFSVNRRYDIQDISNIQIFRCPHSKRMTAKVAW